MLYILSNSLEREQTLKNNLFLERENCRTPLSLSISLSISIHKQSNGTQSEDLCLVARFIS